MRPVDDMRPCGWCGEYKPFGHTDCKGGPEVPPCPDPETGECCGICPSDLAAQAADLGITRPDSTGGPQQ